MTPALVNQSSRPWYGVKPFATTETPGAAGALNGPNVFTVMADDDTVGEGVEEAAGGDSLGLLADSDGDGVSELLSDSDGDGVAVTVTVDLGNGSVFASVPL